MKKILYITICLISILVITDKVKAYEYLSSPSYSEAYILDTGFWGNLNTIKCGSVELPSLIPSIVRTIVNLIKIATPLVLIIMGMMDMVNAVIASDEKKMNESKSKFVKRLLSGALVFFVFTIVQFLVSLVAPEEDSDSILKCVDCMVNDESKCGSIIIREEDTKEGNNKTNDENTSETSENGAK